MFANENRAFSYEYLSFSKHCIEIHANKQNKQEKTGN